MPLPTLNLRDLDRLALVQALGECGGNRLAACQALGISLSTLCRRLRRYGGTKREAWGEANVLASYVATCRRNNTAEWMDGLIESINTFLEKSGDEDRVQLDRRGGSISIVKARQE